MGIRHLIQDTNMTVSQTAEFLGLTTGRVRQMLREGDLSGEKIGDWMWVVHRRSAEKFALQPKKTGRPRTGSRS